MNVNVDIGMITYNHAPYIRKALDSILAQKTSFPFRIIVADDASTDETPAILQEYAHAHPDLFHLILHQKNIGIMPNVLSLYPEYNAKYIAFLEGDDYWTSPEKLEIQVRFLEENPQYIGCAHTFTQVNEHGKPDTKHDFSRRYFSGRVYTLSDAERYILPGQSATLVYHNYVKQQGDRFYQAVGDCVATGDMQLALTLTLMGDIYCMPEAMSAYRIVSTGWTQKAHKRNINAFEFRAMFALEDFARIAFDRKVDYGQAKLPAWYGAFIYYLRYPNHESRNELVEIYHLGNNRLRKLMYLFTHTVAWPFRSLGRRMGKL